MKSSLIAIVVTEKKNMFKYHMSDLDRKVKCQP